MLVEVCNGFAFDGSGEHVLQIRAICVTRQTDANVDYKPWVQSVGGQYRFVGVAEFDRIVNPPHPTFALFAASASGPSDVSLFVCFLNWLCASSAVNVIQFAVEDLS